MCLYLEHISSSFNLFIHLITLESNLYTKWRLLTIWEENKIDNLWLQGDPSLVAIGKWK